MTVVAERDGLLLPRGLWISRVREGGPINVAWGKTGLKHDGRVILLVKVIVFSVLYIFIYPQSIFGTRICI